jgi:hypothetical protein
MDTIADRLADILEKIAAELDALSHRLFRSQATEPATQRRRRAKALISGSTTWYCRAGEPVVVRAD